MFLFIRDISLRFQISETFYIGRQTFIDQWRYVADPRGHASNSLRLVDVDQVQEKNILISYFSQASEKICIVYTFYVNAKMDNITKNVLIFKFFYFGK